MKTRISIIAGLTLAASSHLYAQATNWKEIQKPPLHIIKVQQPKRVELPNGMVIFLQEDHELPVIQGYAVIRGGSREEPAGKSGLVDVYSEVWRTGGTKAKSGDDLDDYLETRAAKIETGGDIDSTSISFDSMKANFDQVYPIFVELMQEPAFRGDKIALAKDQLNTGIARRNDDVDQIASREAGKLVYGADSPYAREATYTSVAAITRADLAAWHDRFVHPNNIILGLHGDFDPTQMEARLRKTFGTWARGTQAPKPSFTAAAPRPGVYFIPKDDVTQSEVRLVHLGVTKDNPDYYAIQVMNELFGGGFSSRLVNNVRTKKGLAYDVSGGIGSSYDHPGVVEMSMGTKGSTTAQAIDALYSEIDSLQKSPIEQPEVDRARESILNSFVFAYDSKAKVLRQRLSLEFYGYPQDFLERYRAGVDKVTPADVTRVANKYIRRGDLSLLVVGKAADFDQPLSRFGTVQPIDIKTPELGASAEPAAGGSAAAPTAAENSPEAMALFEKVVEGLGGRPSVMAVKSLTEKASLSLQKPQQMEVQTEQTVVLPNTLRQTMTMAMGSMTMVVTPSSAWMATPMGVRDMASSQRESALRDIDESPWVMAQRGVSKLTLAVAGEEKVGGVDTKIMQVSGAGVRPVKWYVDPSSGRILRSSLLVAELGETGDRVTDFSDFRTVSGVVFPFKQTVSINGQLFGTVQTTEIQVNVAVDAGMFEKPAK